MSPVQSLIVKLLSSPLARLIVSLSMVVTFTIALKVTITVSRNNVAAVKVVCTKASVFVLTIAPKTRNVIMLPGMKVGSEQQEKECIHV